MYLNIFRLIDLPNYLIVLRKYGTSWPQSSVKHSALPGSPSALKSKWDLKVFVLTEERRSPINGD